jgi:hypothetical protein
MLVLVLFRRWELFDEPFLPTFALSGALHAASLSVALRAPESALRKGSFIAITALLSILTLYIGIVSLQLFGALPAAERLYLVLGLCSVAGAITYGSLIRLFWMRALSSRSILGIAIGCVPATCLAFLIKTRLDLDSWVLAAAWWCAFSAGLAYVDKLAKTAAKPR